MRRIGKIEEVSKNCPGVAPRIGYVSVARLQWAALSGVGRSSARPQIGNPRRDGVRILK